MSAAQSPHKAPWHACYSCPFSLGARQPCAPTESCRCVVTDPSTMVCACTGCSGFQLLSTHAPCSSARDLQSNIPHGAMAAKQAAPASSTSHYQPSTRMISTVLMGGHGQMTACGTAPLSHQGCWRDRATQHTSHGSPWYCMVPWWRQQLSVHTIQQTHCTHTPPACTHVCCGCTLHTCSAHSTARCTDANTLHTDTDKQDTGRLRSLKWSTATYLPASTAHTPACSSPHTNHTLQYCNTEEGGLGVTSGLLRVLLLCPRLLAAGRACPGAPL
jgi:hypothetical protein